MEEAVKDRISDLPDSILHHILSFLEIHYIARTSVLSKRWNYIWITIPTLHFCSLLSRRTEIDKFMDFVDGTLHRHKLSNVVSFCVSGNNHLNESRLHSWISNIISGNVKKLSLIMNLKNPRCIPLSLFTCQSLVSLELCTCPCIHLPKYIAFPRLKRLKLRTFDFYDECWNDQLFSNSPVLEELILQRCIYGISNFSISIPTLKLLEIHTLSGDFYDVGEINALRDCVFKIDAPRLVTFSYAGYVAKGFVFSSFLGTVQADVNFVSDEWGGAEAMSRLLTALAHVNNLIVYDSTLRAIRDLTYPSINLLTNVKMLNISDHLTTYRGLIVLLKAVPNLESLVFSEYMIDQTEEFMTDEDDEDNNDYSEEDGDDEDEENDADSVEGENNHDNEDKVDVSDAAEYDNNDMDEANNDNRDDYHWVALGVVTNGCLFPNLKSVCFQRFVGNQMEMRWVKLILRYATALQTMTFRYSVYDYHSGIGKSEKELMIDIPCFPRASAGCVFKFSSRNPKSCFSLEIKTT